MKNFWIVSVIISIVLILKVTFANSLETITPKDAFALYQNKEAQIVDVREAEEVAQGKIQGAFVIPMSLMENKLAFETSLEKLDKNKKILLYCRSGRRSGIVGEELKNKGFKVLNLKAFSDWKAEGLPIE